MKIKKILKWDNVHIENMALSDQKGEVKLYVPKRNTIQESSPGATIVDQKNQENYISKEVVSTESLDNYCRQKNLFLDFLKIDVEGNEMKIFQGGTAIISKKKPKILVEIEARHTNKENAEATIHFLTGMGYKASFIRGAEIVPISEFSFEKHQNTNDMKHYCNNFIFE